MAQPRHLPNAPITEAVIDIQIDPGLHASFQELEEAFRAADFGYRNHGAIVTQLFQFGAAAVGVSPIPTGSPERIGLRLQSDDDRYVALVRVNGISLSRLTPYETWGGLEAEARRLWNIYAKQWGPKRISRIATRYINNLKLPIKAGESFSVYIDTLTELPASLPQNISAFLQQFQIHDRPTDRTARLSLAWDGKAEGGAIPVILDIDAYMQVATDLTDESVWVALRSLRDLKNQCFFGALTEQAINHYL